MHQYLLHPGGSQRDVVYLDGPIALSYISPNAGWGGRGWGLEWSRPMRTAQINLRDVTPSLTYVYTSPCQCRRRPKCWESSVARSHSLLVFFITYIIHSYTFIHNIRWVRSSFFIAASSGRGSPLGCRVEVRTRGRLTAVRHAINWAMLHPEPCLTLSHAAPWAMPHPV